MDLSKLAVAAPASPSQGLSLAGDLAAGGHFGLMVFDSTAELMTEAFPPGAASSTLRRLRSTLHGKSSVLLFLTTPLSGGWEGESTAFWYPAGFDLAEAAALRLVLSRQRWLRRRGVIAGYQAQVKVLRNRWGEAGRQVTVQIQFNGVEVQDEGSG